MNILLIEDDEVDIIAFERLLKKNAIDHRLYVVNDGLEALLFLEEQHRQTLGTFTQKLLIYLDLYLPKLNGLEFLAKLRFEPKFKKIPVIVLISFDQERYLIEQSNLKIAGYLRKPITFFYH
ncbi:response regulator [Chroococcus sp. FPU101]|uniref:response regulator n=1 Tax=Chroococcus sp. FPU101 TaxID=1974212 RepID=UPI001A8ED18E|nr:response regulator [Chroococcus sp. FPU101]GFE72046.1 response regulator receiver protein [Chroococcus sp. FPU101]